MLMSAVNIVGWFLLVLGCSNLPEDECAIYERCSIYPGPELCWMAEQIHFRPVTVASCLDV